ncbi:MAG: SURF1 family protein [Steroidobacteraceae bacterium]
MKDPQYIVSIRVGIWSFQPRLFTTLLTIALMVMLVSLGRWQLHRAAEKRALFDSFAAAGVAAQPIDLRAAKAPRYSRVLAVGSYDDPRQVLIDNMVEGTRAGYYVITPFALQGGGWVLVNRGWVPLGRTRADRPAVAVGGNVRTIRGRADNLPSPGIRLGIPAPLAPPYPVVAAYPTRADVAQLLKESNWTSATDLILLDAGEPDGYVRNWVPPGFPPMRHIGYAVQWFGLALALAVIYVVTNFRRNKSAPA